jgi:hypothetical protein
MLVRSAQAACRANLQRHRDRVFRQHSRRIPIGLLSRATRRKLTVQQANQARLSL